MSELDTSGWSNEDWLIKRYKYVPSTPAAAIFAALFGLSTMIHLLQLVRRRTWYFIPFLVGGLFETVGYVLRAIDTEAASKLLFIFQTILILLAPALYAASIYMILKRLIITLDAQSYSLVRVRWLTHVFVGCDVLSFLTQGAGGGMLASDSSSDKPGRKNVGNSLVTAGLLLQLVVFGFFMVVTGIFHLRIRRRPTTRSAVVQVPWLRYIYVLYFASTLVTVRTIFRVVEYIQGRDGYLLSHEAFFYVLDATIMFFVSIEFNVFHPSIVVSPWTQDKLERDSIDREANA